MTTKLTIPKLEMSMSEGTLAEWKFESGAAVKEGDVIYVLETDKTTAGETYDCGTEIGEIV
jgi:pyruvate/2-oxoglutarate dehydrogenase complex dihydrolipoamide acyltransferase (E2) component